MEKKIKVNEKEYTIREIPYIEAVGLNPENKQEMIKTLFKACSGLTEEEIKSLSMREGKIFEEAIAEVNGMALNSENFPNPTEEKEQKTN